MRYDTFKSVRLRDDDAAWLAATSERHSLPESKILRLGLAMVRSAWGGEPREIPMTDEGK